MTSFQVLLLEANLIPKSHWNFSCLVILCWLSPPRSLPATKGWRTSKLTQDHVFLEELINTRYYWWVCYSSDCHNNCKNPHVFVASCLLSVQALVWVDCEMTGLGSDGGPGDDSLLEAGRWSAGRNDFSQGFFDGKLLPGNVKMILFSRFFCGPRPLWCFMRNGFSLTKSFGQKRCLVIPSMRVCVLHQLYAMYAGILLEQVSLIILGEEMTWASGILV